MNWLRKTPPFANSCDSWLAARTEFDLALDCNAYRVLSDRVAFLAKRNPFKFIERLLARDASRERFLNSFDPVRRHALFRQNVEIVIRKPEIPARPVLRGFAPSRSPIIIEDEFSNMIAGRFPKSAPGEAAESLEFRSLA
jgi:hypothetical protein